MNSTSPIPLDDAHSSYGYRPTFFVCVLYVALFSSTLGMHLLQMVSSRYWFLAPTVILAAFLEVLGWVGRLWSNQNLHNGDPFMMQICCLIIGPTPLLAANFVVFGRLVSLLGAEYSRLRPTLYAKIFLGCDIVSLCLQGAGGGLASTADSGTSMFDLGTNLMIAGIILQVVMMTIFVILVGEYTYRYIYSKPHHKKVSVDSIRFPLDTRRQLLLLAMGITTVLLFIRGIYRLIELSGGWDSEIMRTEWLFNVFDAAMVFLAFLTWNVAHPAVLLAVDNDASKGGEKRGQMYSNIRTRNNSEETVSPTTVPTREHA
ncbi:envelope glycoprotein [Marasmius crinis-equi]|uniref:Envelope glycoprotein n=1 Tax=Marasmius crinis-equi TaxID=585013 RepID=A0ABR3ER86_9AGAR